MSKKQSPTIDCKYLTQNDAKMLKAKEWAKINKVNASSHPTPQKRREKSSQKKGYISNNEKICYLCKYFYNWTAKRKK